MRLMLGVLVLTAVAIPQVLVAQAPKTETSAIQASSHSPGTPPRSEDYFTQETNRLAVFGVEAKKASSAKSLGVSSPRVETEAKTAFRPTSEPQQAPIQQWRTLLVVEHGAAVFDAWSTRDALQNSGAHELNPLFRPFARSNAIYAATQVESGLFDYLGHRMMTSKKSWMRRWWWVPQVAGTVGSLFSGAHNLAIAQGRPPGQTP